MKIDAVSRPTIPASQNTPPKNPKETNEAKSRDWSDKNSTEAERHGVLKTEKLPDRLA